MEMSDSNDVEVKWKYFADVKNIKNIIESIAETNKKARLRENLDDVIYPKKSFWKSQSMMYIVDVFSRIEITDAVKDLMGGIFMHANPSEVVEHASNLAHYIQDIGLNSSCYAVSRVLPFACRSAGAHLPSSHLSVFGELIKFEGQISLTKKGWYDEWARKKSRDNPLELIAFDYMSSENTKKDSNLWGPYFAAFLVKLREISLEKLKEDITCFFNYFNAYSFGSERRHLIEIPFRDSGAWMNYLIPLMKAEISKPVKLNFYFAMIGLFNYFKVSADMKIFLEFILEPLKFYDMPLLTMIKETCENYACQVSDLINTTCSIKTIGSWTIYEKYYNMYRALDEIGMKVDDTNTIPIFNLDALWPFVRVFSSAYFSDLSYCRNAYLCGMLSLLNDFRKEKYPFSFNGKKTGKLYSRLVCSQKYPTLLSEEEFYLCQTISEMLNSLAHPVMNIGFTDMASKALQEGKDRAEKARKLKAIDAHLHNNIE